METYVLLVVCIGRRCLRLFRHGHDNVFLDHRQRRSWICACCKISHCPNGKIAEVLPRLMLAQLRPTLWTTTVGTCRRDLIFPIAQMGFSHVLHFVLAGWRCVHQRWHGDLVIVHHHWQHRLRSACSRSKFPIAMIGKLLTCLPRLTFAQLRMLRSTTGGACHRDLENFPSPQWDALLLCPPW
jgi:hypothetical protein